MTEKKTYSIRMRPELMKSLKIMAVEKEKSIADLLEEAVTNLMTKYSFKRIDRKKG